MPLLFALIAALGLTIPASGTCQEVSIRRVHRIISGPSPADPFRSPRGLAVDRKHGIVAVGDNGGHRVVFFDSLGRYRGALSWRRDVWGKPLGQPRSVSVDARGRLFILDALGREIEVLSPTGSRLGRLQLELPGDFAGAPCVSAQVGASRKIYALIAGARRGIAVLEPNGALGRIIDFGDPNESSFVSPEAFAVSPDETRIAVLDQRATLQVKVISMNGTLLQEYGAHAEGPGNLSMAVSATWGPQQSLWIVDTIRHSINVFDAEGKYVDRFGGFGHGPGQLNYPTACAFLKDERLVVLERAGSRLQFLDLNIEFLEYSRAGLEVSGSGARGRVFSL